MKYFINVNDVVNYFKENGNEDQKYVVNNHDISAFERLDSEIRSLLDEYNWGNTPHGRASVIYKWIEHKAPLIRKFMSHPRYNGFFQIIHKGHFERKFDSTAIELFIAALPIDFVISDFDISNGKVAYGFDNGKFLTPTEEMCVKEVYGNAMTATLHYLRNIDHQFLSNVDEANLAVLCPELKARKGKKLSRVMRQLMVKLGFDKLKDHEAEFAKYADSVNPLSVDKTVIISLNPIDYLTMSFGNSWGSCHTIDKTNKRDVEENYRGCYCGGTLSYMLDLSSMVFYTVRDSYCGDKYELQDKVNRQMFHFGHGKLIQGRLYPQSCDTGSSKMYTTIRNIMQELMANLLGVPNMWSVKRGTDECDKATVTHGSHYPDYVRFDQCNVSTINGNKDDCCVDIGNRGICFNCGSEHDLEEYINCCGKTPDGCECEYCGERIDTEDALYNPENDRYYCCSECAERDGWLMDDYGDWYSTDDAGYCNSCGNVTVFNDGETVIAEDGTVFCCAECASNRGYVLTYDGKWRDEDDCAFDPNLEAEIYIHDSDVIKVEGEYFADEDSATDYGCVIIDGEWYLPESVTEDPDTGEIILKAETGVA